MAISKMAKVMIVSHRCQVSGLLEVLQYSGICQVLNAEEAMISKEHPDLAMAGKKPKQIQDTLNELSKNVAFLKDYADTPKGLAAALAPKAVVAQSQYDDTTTDEAALEISHKAARTQQILERVKTDIENLHGQLHHLEPWAPLEIPVEQLRELNKAVCITGLLAANKLNDIKPKLDDLDTAVEQVGVSGIRAVCIFIALKENESELHKLLRSIDFETVSFEAMTGTIAELQKKTKAQLDEKNQQLQQLHKEAQVLAKDYLKLQILHDHYANLLTKEQTQNDCPATEQAVILESWVRRRDMAKLDKIVSKFDAAQVSEITPAKDEQIPVEIENKALIKPFEFITRLYGMPDAKSVDPTVFLAPFFAIFFGLCVADAGYGIILAFALYWLMKKLQSGKAAAAMFLICSIMTVIAGVLTGSWFADTAKSLLPEGSQIHTTVNSFITKMTLFDPMTQPKTFFILAVSLGYIQIMFALVIGFLNNLFQKNIMAAVFDQLVWLLFLNILGLFAVVKAGLLRPEVTVVLTPAAIVLAIAILFFSERGGGWGERLGMGAFALFGTVFYVGDMLSYVRLMALGMVSAGFGMAINVLVKLMADIPYVGLILAAIMFVAGHLFNLALSLLSAFVHSLRLQFVEFFPKFLVGGGRDFKPLAKQYSFVELSKQD